MRVCVTDVTSTNETRLCENMREDYDVIFDGCVRWNDFKPACAVIMMTSSEHFECTLSRKGEWLYSTIL